MRVAYFTNHYIPQVSGITTSVVTFRSEIEKRGHEVFIFTPRFKGYDYNDPRVITYPSIQTNFKTDFPVAIFPSVHVIKEMRRIKPDVLHAHNSLWLWLGGEALRFSWTMKKPLVYTAHSCYEHYAHYAPFLPQWMTSAILLKEEVRYCNFSSAVIAPTESMKQNLLARGVKTPVHVISSGIDPAMFTGIDREEARQKLGINPDEILLMFLGRMAREKNIDLIIQILPRLFEKYSQVKMIGVGEGTERAKLQVLNEKYPGRVITTGEIAHGEVPRHYVAADIFLQPSLSETQGITTLEAMAAGTAVVAVRAQGAQDLVEDGISGFLVPAEEEAFFAGVDQLISDRELLAKTCENAKKKAGELTVEKMTDKMLAVYEGCVKPA